MVPTTLKQIRNLHAKYLRDRKSFDDAKGIISPIRACVFTDDISFANFLMDYSVLDEQNQHIAWKNRSFPIGYMAACKELATGKIKTAWSICALADLEDNAFDKEYGIQLALSRLFIDTDKFSISKLPFIHYGQSRAVLNSYPILFFGNYDTIADQAIAFRKRCMAYYKVGELE